MSWSIGYDSNWKRDIGYGVPASCDHPGCGKVIDRGLGCVCGGEPYGGEKGCGLYFCGDHLFGFEDALCDQCSHRRKPFKPTLDRPYWMAHKLVDESWEKWRKENPEEVALLKERVTQDEIAMYRAVAKLELS